MILYRISISVDGYKPITLALEPIDTATPPTAPPDGADATGAIGAGKAGKRGGMTNAQKCRAYRARHQANGVARHRRDTGATPKPTPNDTTDTVGGVGGGLSSESPIFDIRSEMQQHTKTTHKTRDTATPTPTPRDTETTPGSETMNPYQHHRAEIERACQSVAEAWPKGTVGGGPSKLSDIERIGVVLSAQDWFPKPSSPLDGVRFILARIEAWKVSKRYQGCVAVGVKIPGWRTWSAESLGQNPPLHWDDYPASTAPPGRGGGRGDGWGGDAAARAMGVKS